MEFTYLKGILEELWNNILVILRSTLTAVKKKEEFRGSRVSIVETC